MRAYILERPAPIATAPLKPVERAPRVPGPGEALVAVSACGVCRTDLHVVEGDLALPRLPLVPGHQVVGRIVSLEPAPRSTPGRSVHSVGDRVGVPWVHRFCGRCRYCLEGRENLCDAPIFTGFHVDGGYAELITASLESLLPLPPGLGSDVEVAPLLCAGVIGFRALRRAGLSPEGGGGRVVALYGFGASAHLALQVARAWGWDVHVFTRAGRAESVASRARALGASWVGSVEEDPPAPSDAAVSFAPAGSLIPRALRHLRKGATLAIAGIHLDQVPALDYDTELFEERSLTSVTANTRSDATGFLLLAARAGIRSDVQRFPWSAANEALAALAGDRLSAQCAVLQVADP